MFALYWLASFATTRGDYVLRGVQVLEYNDSTRAKEWVIADIYMRNGLPTYIEIDGDRVRVWLATYNPEDDLMAPSQGLVSEFDDYYFPREMRRLDWR